MIDLAFAGLSSNQIEAFAVISGMTLFVGAMVFLFRELGAVPQVAEKKQHGRFGFPISRGEVVEMKVVQIRQLSPSVKNYILEPLAGYVDYQPGQFLSFHTGDDGKVVRCYSLNSSPTRPGMYEVSVKLVKEGLGSTWVHDKVHVGDTLKVTNPSGRFFLRQEAKGSVFVAGGVGITAMVAMLKYAMDSNDQRPLYFFYAAQSFDELIFHDELESLVSRSPNAHYMPMLKEPPVGWTYQTGRINAKMMLDVGVNFPETDLYTCGPTAMMESVKAIAIEHGMPESNFYNEIFTSPASQKMERRQCQVKLTQSNKVLDYDSDVPLLDFLENNNVDVASSCRAGVCGTCEISIESGEVHQLPSDFLSQEDMEAGTRLSCICYPLGDVEIDL